MKPLNFSLLVLFTVVSSIYPFYESNRDLLEIVINNSSYLLISIILLKQISGRENLGLIIAFIIFCIYYIIFDAFDLMRWLRFQNNYDESVLHYAFIFEYYLAFIILFKKKGSALYTGSRKDIFLGFALGFVIFFSIVYNFYGQLALTFQPLLLVLAVFKSYFSIITVNTPVSLKKRLILLTGVLLNFASVYYALYLIQAGDNSRLNHNIYVAVFRVGFLCLLYVGFDLQERYSPKSRLIVS